MRMSCNGCRVLRKGCGSNCSIRPCLQWIPTPESQANATVFLAKFYGRAGLVNLINACPQDHLRPAVFRSLLYEACGRILNPIYGSVGLLWSGSWHLCQTAVEAVLKGDPIIPIPSETAAATPVPAPLRAYDIRHVGKGSDGSAALCSEMLRVSKGMRAHFKRSGAHAKAGRVGRGSKSCESSENESSAEAGSQVSQADGPGRAEEGGVEVGLDLELTLGLQPARPAVRAEPERTRVEMDCWDDETSAVGLALYVAL